MSDEVDRRRAKKKQIYTDLHDKIDPKKFKELFEALDLLQKQEVKKRTQRKYKW